jgi:hypothetical protein
VRLDCPDDSAAIKQAEHMLDGYSVEIWQLERRIGRFVTSRARLAQRSFDSLEEWCARSDAQVKRSKKPLPG